MKSILVTALSVLSLFSNGAQAVPASSSWPTSSCSYKNIRVRKEWSMLTLSERKCYTDAVKCLQNSPSKLAPTNPSLYPGVQSRYDDFVATHINYTETIHLDGVFLSWHRNFVWLYEQALRNECGYQGAQPYWNWPSYTAPNTLESSALFDGSEYSMSGNGIATGDTTPYVLGPNVFLPHGSGGGCVTTGPFANYQVRLGPFNFSTIFTGQPPPNAYASNPRCLTRDLNDYVLTSLCNQSAIDYLLSQPTILDFQNTFSVPPGNTTQIGAHPAGHVAVGVEMQDFFSSPNDPMFQLHHAMVDKVWYDWQLRDPVNRIYGNNAVAGGSTTDNIPPSPPIALSYLESWGVLDQPRPVMDMMSTLAGPFCYIYA